MWDNQPTLEDIEIPKTVAEAVEAAFVSGDYLKYGSFPFQPKFWARVVLLSLAMNPIVPSVYDFQKMRKTRKKGVERRVHYVREWFGMAFLCKPYPVPESVKSLLVENLDNSEFINAKILAAVEIGKRLGKESTHE